MSYTRKKLIFKLEQSKNKMHLFYKQDFINYRGKTSDTNEMYSEVVCEWLLDNITLLDNIPMITRKKSYKIESHDGVIKNANSGREEEIIAMKMYGNEYDCIGEIIDYQTPLKNNRYDEAGKIDLLSYDGTTLRILELKKPNSDETMLRCVLESYTYLKTIDNAKLLEDFGISCHTLVKACPFVFRNGEQHKEMQLGRPYLKHLMDLLDTKPYYISTVDGKYIITGD
ncbi:MAG: hypothetical protein E7508_01320 [Ruminococcus sp.]|nr:hypothetical protein [Ruminococcus sp.]